MTQINSYLTFNGNCKEAMNFYKDCLNGELYIQKVGDSPMSDKMSPEMKESVLHSELRNGNLILMGSDMVPEQGLIKGNSVSLMLHCKSEEELEDSFKKLSEGGIVSQALDDTFWGARFGHLTDKYGNHWLLNFMKDKSN